MELIPLVFLFQGTLRLMAIEEHPLYPEWSIALDELKAVNDRLREVRNINPNAAMPPELQAQLSLALSNYNKISDQIDV